MAAVALAAIPVLVAVPEPLSAAAPCAPVIDPKKPDPQPDPPSGLRILSWRVMDRLFTLGARWSAGAPRFSRTVYAAGADFMDPSQHAYFDQLSLRSDCMVAYSLRDAAQLFQYAQSTSKPQDVTYDPASDPDPRRQDAAKILIKENQVSLGNNIFLPIPPVGTDSLFVTWDSWMGKEFAYENTGIGNYKHFQLTSPLRTWTEIKADFNEAEKYKPAIAMVESRFYGEKKNGEAGPNVVTENPLTPQANKFGIMAETWTRYWVFLNPAGEWHEFSLWAADASRGPVQILDRLQIKPNYELGATGWEKFWLEYNTSSHGLDSFGPRVAYARNVVMLRGVSNPLPLLQRPN
jgi:hypothetical protein